MKRDGIGERDRRGEGGGVRERGREAGREMGREDGEETGGVGKEHREREIVRGETGGRKGERKDGWERWRRDMWAWARRVENMK